MSSILGIVLAKEPNSSTEDRILEKHAKRAAQSSEMPPTPSPKMDQHVYKVVERLGTVHGHDPELERWVSQELLQISNGLPVGSTLILDFAGVELIGSVLLRNIVTIVANEGKASLGRGVFRGRYLVIKDPSVEVQATLESFVRGIHRSVLVVHADTGSPSGLRSQILNLPDYLQETLDIVSQHRRLTSEKVAEYLGGEKGPSARERLRQLYRRGLVVRYPSGSAEGERFFIYEPFGPELGS